MQLGVRGRLFLVSLTLMSIVGFASALYLEYGLRSWLQNQLESSMYSQALTVREALGSADTATTDRADPIADRLGKAAGVRLTLIDGDGKVLGDSEVPTDRIAALENHGSRPEVIAAKKNGRGVAHRYSTTLEVEHMYVAVAMGDRVVRVARPVPEIDATIGRLHFLMGVAGAVGLMLSVIMSFLASHLMSRTLRRMVQHARGLVRGDGSRLDVPSTDEIGRLAGSINRMADELEGTLATLARERGRFETVLDSMSEALLAVDADRRITLINVAARKLLELDGDVVDKSIDDVAEIPNEVGELVTGEQSQPDSIEFTLDDGTKRTALARARPLTATGGRVIVMLDVTEMRRLERIRRDFVANVSHELRTPTSIILANAETLLDGGLEDPKRAPSFVEAIHRNSKRLSAIIADLLELSRIEAGKYQLDMRPMAIRQATLKAADAVTERAKTRNVEVKVDDFEEADVTADRKALSQVLNNLLENAVKYSEEGGHVVVRAKEVAGRVRIEVADDGPGIPEKYRERVFERFYRIDKGRSRDTGGTGLGLAIVKHYVESMRGKVGVDPNEPTGSCFWFELPTSKQTSLNL